MVKIVVAVTLVGVANLEAMDTSVVADKLVLMVDMTVVMAGGMATLVVVVTLVEMFKVKDKEMEVAMAVLTAITTITIINTTINTTITMGEARLHG